MRAGWSFGVRSRAGAVVALALLCVLLAGRPMRAGADPAGTALDFDGSNDRVTFGAAPGLGVSTFTIETWFMRQGTGVATSTGTGGVTDAIPLVTKGRAESDGSNVDMNYFLGIKSGTNTLMADFEDTATGANHPVVGDDAVSSNAWHHAAVTYDGTTWRLYLDGNLDVTVVAGSFTPRFDSIQHAGLATAMTSTGAAAGFFNGVMDEARVWNYARSGAQIASGMGQEIASASGLVGRWGMNDGSGTTIADSSGGGSAGTAVNGPLWVSGFPATAGSAPDQPTLNAPSNGANGIPTSATLDAGVTDADTDAMTVTFYGRKAPTPVAPDFTFVAIPDTQHYVDNPLNTPTFGQQTQWILDHRVDLNIAFVSHLGDIVQNIDQSQTEWEAASGYMAMLDANGVKNNVAPGNHDLNTSGVGAKFDTYFPPSRYSGFSWYGGYLGSDPVNDPINRLNRDNFELFSVGGLDFVVIHLEYDMPGYAVSWAARVLEAYPQRRAIIVTHAFLNGSGVRPTSVVNRPDGTPAETVWQTLVKTHCNVFLVLNGHYSDPGPEARRVDNNNCGQPVNQILTDFQDRANGGDGWMRYYTFKPSENKIYAHTYSPKFGQFETDADSEFSFSYDMQPAAPFSVIGTRTSVPSTGSAQVTWGSLLPLTGYEWYVTSSDQTRTTTGPVWTFTTGTAQSVGGITEAPELPAAAGGSGGGGWVWVVVGGGVVLVVVWRRRMV